MDYARPPYSSFFQLSILTGLRTGEVLGLRFEDFDFERGLLFIRRARTGGHLVEPKSLAGIRELPIFRPVREIYLRRQAGNFKGSPWVMYSERGEVFSRSTLRRIWKGLLRAFDISARPMYAYKAYVRKPGDRCRGRPPMDCQNDRARESRSTLAAICFIFGRAKR